MSIMAFWLVHFFLAHSNSRIHCAMTTPWLQLHHRAIVLHIVLRVLEKGLAKESGLYNVAIYMCTNNLQWV